MTQIYCFGHRQPDTDSIASVIGYADFKNRSEPGRMSRPGAGRSMANPGSCSTGLGLTRRFYSLGRTDPADITLHAGLFPARGCPGRGRCRPHGKGGIKKRGHHGCGR